VPLSPEVRVHLRAAKVSYNGVRRYGVRGKGVPSVRYETSRAAFLGALRALREEGVTQQAIATHLGVSRGSIAQWCAALRE
jgi:biotin operon repressor